MKKLLSYDQIVNCVYSIIVIMLENDISVL